MVEKYRNRGNTADAIIVGGGSVGLHTANALYDTMGGNAKILAVTQEAEWGGIAGRSLEQYRMFNDSYALAEIVSKGTTFYDRLDEELRDQKSTTRAYEQFPYIFTVGDKQRPDYLAELLPHSTPERPDMNYYRTLKAETESWGFDPRASELTVDELRERYPLLNGNGIQGAMVVENAGRLHFDVMRNWLMERSRADGNGRGVTYRNRTAARQIMLGKNGVAIGVDFGNEKVYSDKVILAVGAFALDLARLIPGEESERIANNFTISQRELFFANLPGVQDDTKFFLISPDMAIARVSASEGHACYGYAADDDLIITQPSTDPRPNGAYDTEWQINKKDLFVGRTYALLGECSLRWNPDIVDRNKPNLAVEPFGHSAGYYSAYRDGLPVVGKVADTGVVLAAGSHHSGIMGGQGIAELTVDHVLGTQNLSKKTHEQTDVSRDPIEHAGLVL